ncbi:MAG TPA: hypothetical protein VF559_13230 [Caulobacteraceae bacterium]|jgi:ElaB/YqjD/DUF883 family membrane-anchored ribosome-binding protein
MAATSSLNPALDENRTDGGEGGSERSLQDMARRAEQAVHEGLDTLRLRSMVYRDTAREQMDQAGRYVTGQVQERPLTTTLAALGVGVLVGFILSGGRR